MKYGAVIVDNRDLPNMAEIIERHKKFLPADWEILHIKDVEIGHFHDYNRLLGSVEFWEKIPFDKILIFQHDTGLLREGIEKFLEWDYVGAPWTFQLRGGNGGLSLRTKQVMIDCLKKTPYNVSIHGNEDLYFSNHIHLVGGKLAPRKVCEQFSVESIYQLGTLGYHNIANYHGEDGAAKIINQYNPDAPTNKAGMVIGLIILHYGKEYLKYAVESIYDSVDKIVLVYSDKPTHGHNTPLRCPDTREELIEQVEQIDFDNKVLWIDKNFDNEHSHRNFAYDKCKALGADMVVVTDADEVWERAELKKCLEIAAKEGKARYRIMMQHFYRSFSEVCRDPHRQVRILNPKAKNNEEVDIHTENPVIHHFGYAQSEAIINYKMSCHGHKSEIRGNWFQDKFLDYKYNTTNDVHPVCLDDFWHPQYFNKLLLPRFMHSHPYFNLDKI